MKIPLPKFILDRLPQRVALRAEPVNVSSSATAATVSAALRSAESGETRQLFALYRDIIVGDSHIQTEFSKRKLALIGDTLNILPRDKNKPEDVKAAEAVRQAIEDCEGWMDALTFALDSSLYPVSVLQKVFRPADPGSGLRFTLKQLVPINYAVLCLRQPWLRHTKTEIAADQMEPWEPDLRFYPIDEQGNIQYYSEHALPANPAEHLVHRGHLLVGIRDAWGGPMRSIVYWWLLGVLGREWFSRFMERFGNPFILVKTDSTNKEAVQFLTEALSLSTKVGGLVVDHETEVELKEAMLSGGADAYDKFLAICNREKSKAIVGQELSTTAAPTGMGSGVANLQSQVRDDIRMFDQIKLAETLEKQLFKQILQINGLAGAVPRVRWGGLSVDEATATGALLVSLSQAGFEPTDEAMPGISERIGIELQRKAFDVPGMNFFPGQNFNRPLVPEKTSNEDPTVPDKKPVPGASVPGGDVQAAALNGAQVTALAELASQVALGTLPLETAKGIAAAAFPLVSPQLIEKIFQPLKSFEPTLPEPKTTQTLTALSATLRATHPSDKIVEARAKVLGEAYRGAMAPFRQIILASRSKEDCLEKLAAFYPDWKPERLNAEFETAMQLCAAAGAAAAKP